MGSGKGASLNELIDIMSEVAGQKVVPDYIKDSGTYISKIVLDISRIQKETGWKPTTELSDGINKTWEWIKML